MNLSSRQLRAFVALAEERHFTRAAQRSHMTQPAFSALIRMVEAEVGLRLFDRSTRHVSLTTEGEIFLSGALRLLGDFEAMQEGMSDYASQRQGRVSLAALPSLAAGWLPGILADYHERHPGVRLELRDALLDPCLDMVRNGQVDFAVAAGRADMSELTSDFLYADDFFIVCRVDHPLAKCEGMRLSALAKWPRIQLARGSSVRQALDGANDKPTLLLEVEHLATVAGLVLAGLGISVVPGMTLFHFRHPSLVIRPLADKRLRRSLYLVRRKGKSLSVAAAALYEQLLESREQIRVQA
ncbi:LysR family transcriptional regulator [Paracandidimonas soli]|uniref:LysR family transcriptional regulator n=1 Tax=Paracandidimonas soli TaxID=1917182 RepID=UPI0033427828